MDVPGPPRFLDGPSWAFFTSLPSPTTTAVVVRLYGCNTGLYTRRGVALKKQGAYEISAPKPCAEATGRLLHSHKTVFFFPNINRDPWRD
jgi:hypothetical protein